MGLQLTGAWSSFLKLFGPTTRGKLDDEVRKRMREQLKLLRLDILRYTETAPHGIANSPLTILTKRGNRPLIDTRRLQQAIKIAANWEGRGTSRTLWGAVGVQWGARTRNGRDLVVVARTLHEGGTVRVTKAVRAAVFAELRRRGQGNRNKYTKGVFLTGGSGARTWRIRPRPFIRVPFEAAQPRIRVALGSGVAFTFEGA
jgi:hypothetical protein